MEQAPCNELPIVESALKINPVYFDEVSFKRLGPPTNDATIAPQLSVRKSIIKQSDGLYRVIVALKAERKAEYSAEVQISGYCTIEETTPNKDKILNENAISILFAHIRSELTLLTSQPGVAPIVLPVVNIAEMLKIAEKRLPLPKA